MAKKESNPMPPNVKLKPHPPPKPPLCRLFREDVGVGTCPKCGSSIIKTKYFFFGKKKCINTKCGGRVYK